MKRLVPIPTSVLYACLALALGLVILMNSPTLSGFSVTPSIVSTQSVGNLPAVNTTPRTLPSYNILLVVLDDWGQDGLDTPNLAVGTDLPHTPTLNALATQGVVFPNMWVTTVCCSTRAQFLTGQFPFRNGIGKILKSSDVGEFDLQPSVFTLPEAIKAGTNNRYATIAIGKWHLTHDPNGPNVSGFDYYAGSIWNLSDMNPAPSNVYYNYPKTVNGVTTQHTVYATTDQVNDAITQINALNGEPFFMYLSFNAPHTPLHVPPAGLHYQGSLPNCVGINKRKCWKADIEAVDTELGRLLSSISPEVLENTMIFVTGDNGTNDNVILPPHKPSRGKGSVYEEGVNVPLIVKGPLVRTPGSVSNAIVNGSDFYRTFARVIGFNLNSVLPSGTVLDSVTFLPNIANPSAPSQRKFGLTEHFMPNGFVSPGVSHGIPKTPPAIPYVQPVLMQYQGPGTPTLSVCCDFLDLGNRADATVTGSFPNAPVELYISQDETPTPLYGGTLVSNHPPERTLYGTTDASGNVTFSDAFIVDIENFQQPREWFAQARITDPANPGQYHLTNAVHVNYNYETNIKAIRNEAIPGKCYKLIISMNGNPQYEELYHLCSDPFEQNNLLASGPLTPGTEAHTNYTSLKTQLDAWV